jgi:hypothetical protein
MARRRRVPPACRIAQITAAFVTAFVDLPSRLLRPPRR